MIEVKPLVLLKILLILYTLVFSQHVYVYEDVRSSRTGVVNCMWVLGARK